MTNSEMFKNAHRYAREDFTYNAELPEIMRKSYAHYFRLQLLNLQRTAREERTGMCRAFQVVEPWYKRQRWQNGHGWVNL